MSYFLCHNVICLHCSKNIYYFYLKYKNLGSNYLTDLCASQEFVSQGHVLKKSRYFEVPIQYFSEHTAATYTHLVIVARCHKLEYINLTQCSKNVLPDSLKRKNILAFIM